MLGMLAISALFALLGLLGLLVAALAETSSTQYMGIGLLLLSWFLAIRYHGHRASLRSRERSS